MKNHPFALAAFLLFWISTVNGIHLNCPFNKVYTTCGGCERTCEERLNRRLACTLECRVGCFCPPNTYWHDQLHKCVPASQCTVSVPKCPSNKVYTTCGGCEKYCRDKWNTRRFCTLDCQVGCFCPPNTYWHDQLRKCVPASQCTEYDIFVTPERFTFEEARSYCKSRGGDLIQNSLSSSDSHTRSYYQRKLSLAIGISGWYHVGFTKVESRWKFLNGKAFDPTSDYVARWGAGEPNNYDESENCGSISNVGPNADYIIFNDWRCFLKGYGVCEAEVEVRMFDSGSWINFPSFLEYHIFITPEPYTFDEARSYCKSRGGDLIQNALSSTDSHTRSYYQRKLSLAIGLSGWYHVGFTKVGSSWQFLNGKVFDPAWDYVARWGTGEPNNYGGSENCGSIANSGKYIIFNDWHCSGKVYGVCEAEVEIRVLD